MVAHLFGIILYKDHSCFHFATVNGDHKTHTIDFVIFAYKRIRVAQPKSNFLTLVLYKISNSPFSSLCCLGVKHCCFMIIIHSYWVRCIGPVLSVFICFGCCLIHCKYVLKALSVLERFIHNL